MKHTSTDAVRAGPVAGDPPTVFDQRDASSPNPRPRKEIVTGNLRVVERLRREIAATLALCIVLAFAAFTASTAHAQAMSQARSERSVDYVTGGIGKEEADMLKQASADYSLTVELASSGPLPTDNGIKGYYITGATVDIRDSEGHSVLTTTTDGPFLLARLPDGIYTIETAWNGVRKHATVDVAGKKRSHVVFDYARGAE